MLRQLRKAIVGAVLLRRLIPAFVALAVALAPISLAACEVTCESHVASHEMSKDADAHHSSHSSHSCHEATAPPVDSLHATAVPHACGHTAVLPVTPTAAAKSLVQTAPVVDAVIPLHVPSLSLNESASGTILPDGIPIPLLLPLRI